MALFSNLFFDAVIGIAVLIIFSEIVIPLWKGKPFFPSVRKLKTLIQQTKENISEKRKTKKHARKNDSDNHRSDPARDNSEPGQNS